MDRRRRQAARDPRSAGRLTLCRPPLRDLPGRATLCGDEQRPLRSHPGADATARGRTASGSGGFRPRRDRYVSQSRQRTRPRGRAGPARPSHFRARCHDEPAADLGHRLQAASRHVPGGWLRRRPRRPACLLSRLGRMPRVALGGRAATARDADGAHRLPGRSYPNRQGSRPCAPRKRQPEGRGSGLHRRRHGGIARRPLLRRRRTRIA